MRESGAAAASEIAAPEPKRLAFFERYLTAWAFLCMVNSSPEVLEELNELPTRTVSGAVILVRDVALVHDGYQPQQNAVRLNGVLRTVLKSGMAGKFGAREGVFLMSPV
ncbi:MAG: hypothetical protein ACYC6M_12590 [Terriglobales bacterium]